MFATKWEPQRKRLFKNVCNEMGTATKKVFKNGCNEKTMPAGEPQRKKPGRFVKSEYQKILLSS
jgi:hypothetical protein